MILVFPVVLAVAFAILWQSRGDSGGEGRGWRWFWAWSVVGAALSFSFITGFSIGLLVLPLALVLLWIVLRASPRLRESIGFVEGVGVVLLVIAYRNHGHPPCAAGGHLQVPPGYAGETVTCSGADPRPWLFAGLVVVVVAAIAYAVARQRPLAG